MPAAPGGSAGAAIVQSDLGRRVDPAVASAEPRSSGLYRSWSREPQCELLILNENANDRVPGWGVRDIEEAYNLPSTTRARGRSSRSSTPRTTPTSRRTLPAYRRHYGLPKEKFYKYNQDGQQGHYPKGNRAGAARST